MGAVGEGDGADAHRDFGADYFESLDIRKTAMPFLPRAGSVMAKTIANLARLTLVKNYLASLMAQWPSFNMARVIVLWVSGPESGSVRQKQPMSLPAARSESQASCCCWVLYLRTGRQRTELCTLITDL